MKSTPRITAAALALLIPIGAQALSPDLTSRESVNFHYANYDDFTLMSGSIRTESPLYRSGGLWSFTAELRGGRLSQDIGPSFDRIGGELGLKLHASPVTDLYGSVGYDRFLGSPDYDATSLTLGARQCFLPTDSPIVPFIRANWTTQFIDPTLESPARQTKDYRLSVIELMGGLEVRTQKTLRWAFEGGRSQSKAVNNAGPDLADGWLIRIAMIYDWF